MKKLLILMVLVITLSSIASAEISIGGRTIWEIGDPAYSIGSGDGPMYSGAGGSEALLGDEDGCLL